MHPEVAAGAVLGPDVGLGGGVVADEDHGEAGADAGGGEVLQSNAAFFQDAGGGGFAINQDHKEVGGAGKIDLGGLRGFKRLKGLRGGGGR